MTAEGREGTPLCCITAPSFSSRTSTSASSFASAPSLSYSTSIAVTKRAPNTTEDAVFLLKEVLWKETGEWVREIALG